MGLSSEARRRLSQAEPHELASTAWALAEMAFTDRPCLDAIASAARRNLRELYVLAPMINTVWSVSVRSFAVLPWRTAIAAAALRKLTEFDTWDLGRLAW